MNTDQYNRCKFCMMELISVPEEPEPSAFFTKICPECVLDDTLHKYICYFEIEGGTVSIYKEIYTFDDGLTVNNNVYCNTCYVGYVRTTKGNIYSYHEVMIIPLLNTSGMSASDLYDKIMLYLNLS